MKYIFALVLVFIFNVSFSQYNLEWVRTYEGPISGTGDISKSLSIDDSGNVYVTGSSSISSTQLEIVTIKYNNSGDTLWKKHFYKPGNFVGHQILLDDSGGVFLAAGLLLKYSTEGRQIWEKYDSAAYKKIILGNDGYIYAGGVRNGQLVSGKYDKNGNRIWKRIYSYDGSAGTDVFGGIALDSNYNFIITCGSRAVATYFDYATLKYSTNGDLLWERRYNGSAPKSGNSNDNALGVSCDVNNNVYVIGKAVDELNQYNCEILKYDAGGNLLKIFKIPGTSVAIVGNNLDFDKSFNIYGTGRFTGGRTSLFKLDSLGNMIWYKIYPQGNAITNNYPILFLDSMNNAYTTAIGITNTFGDYVGLKYDSSGNNLFTITYNSEPPNNFDYVYDMKIDKLGNVFMTGESRRRYLTVKFSPMPTNIISSNYQVNENYLNQNYPNPFNPVTEITYFLNESTNVTLKIYDSSGKEINLLINGYKEKGFHKILFNGENLASGIYFCQLVINNFEQTKQMVLLK